MTSLLHFSSRRRRDPSRKSTAAAGRLDSAETPSARDLLRAQEIILIGTIRSLGPARVRKIVLETAMRARRSPGADSKNQYLQLQKSAADLGGDTNDGNDGERVDWASLLQATTAGLADLVLGDEHLSDVLLERLAVRVAEKLATGRSGADVPGVAALDPLAAARQRGAAAMKAALDSPANLSLAGAAELTGFSERHINERRNQGRYYALVAVGSLRGYRYPAWQFEAETARLERVLRALNAKKLSCWTIDDFLSRTHADLGLPPYLRILDPSFPVERIVAAVEQRFSEADQGAA